MWSLDPSFLPGREVRQAASMMLCSSSYRMASLGRGEKGGSSNSRIPQYKGLLPRMPTEGINLFIDKEQPWLLLAGPHLPRNFAYFSVCSSLEQGPLYERRQTTLEAVFGHTRTLLHGQQVTNQYLKTR